MTTLRQLLQQSGYLEEELPKELEHRFDPCGSLIACAEHGGDSEPGRPDCAACHQVTIEENLSRAMEATLSVEERARLGFSSFEAWHKAAADLHLWDDLLRAWDPADCLEITQQHC